MARGTSDRIYYHASEGRSNLPKTVSLVRNAATRLGVHKIVMFTADGEGPLLAAERFKRSGLEIVACTFGHGTIVSHQPQMFATGIPNQTVRDRLGQLGVHIVQGGMPFDDAFIPGAEDAKLKIILETLNLFGGGFSLCIQAIVMATEAGQVEPGEDVLAMSADTAIVASGALRRSLFAPWGMVVKRVICKPERLTITKKVPPSAPAGPLELPETP